MKPFKEFIQKHIKAFVGGGIGLLITILFLTIGFFPTMLLVLLVSLGALIGESETVRLAIKTWVLNLFKK